HQPSLGPGPGRVDVGRDRPKPVLGPEALAGVQQDRRGPARRLDPQPAFDEVDVQAARRRAGSLATL
ncbi:hypothetical protein, partial [Escherichia coli]|uniref:hypothetical protein n=1 Tax=Escherichia coli TaxID=562 RepID=UPI001952DD60